MRKILMLFAVTLAFALCLCAGYAVADETETIPTGSDEKTVVTEPTAPATENTSGVATDFDFLRFAKEQVLPDFHPTAKPEDAISEYDKVPYDAGEGVIAARVRIFYKGWVRKHEMVSEVELRPDAKLVKVTVLSDTNGVNLVGSKTFRDNSWVELSSMNWE